MYVCNIYMFSCKKHTTVNHMAYWHTYIKWAWFYIKYLIFLLKICIL